MTMLEIIRVLLTITGVFVAVSLLRSINVKRELRAGQLITVFAGGIFAVIAIVLAYKFYDLIHFSDDGKWYDLEIIVWNLIIMAGFVVIKILSLPIIKKFSQDNSKIDELSSNWYKFGEDEGIWLLKDNYRHSRTIFNVFSWIATLLCGAYLSFGVVLGEESELWIKMFPCAGLLVIIEMYNFLFGYTKPEYMFTIGGDSISSTRISAYYKLRNILESIFPTPLLVSHTGNEFPGKEGATELLKNLQESSSNVDRVVSEYFSQNKKSDGLFDVDMINVTKSLLEKQSTVIFNPFYRDLSDYLLLPIIHNLMIDKNCLVVIGRSDLSDDIQNWVCDILKDYSKTRALWRVENLSKDQPECEVGILSFAQLYDMNVIKANSDFIKKTGFVLLIEPSKSMTTSQSGLSIIVEKMEKTSLPTFCICDRNVDGLVDTMSHILKTNLTNVVASPTPRSIFTTMAWSASGDFARQNLFDKQTHYLGNGTEISAVALKNQIPHVSWLSAEKAPVNDLKWIAGQYYSQICKYAHLPNQQKALDERITFSSNLWGANIQKEDFVIVEDEFCNLFTTLRAYLTRGSEQSFVNVISENYLLRDYMRYNRQLFMTDPKAIPSIASYYSKTEHNTIIRLILMMACKPVSEEYILHELNILGYNTDDVYQTLSELIFKHTFVKDTIVTMQNSQNVNDNLMAISEARYSIGKEVFEQNFASTLKNAFFVVEDEKFGVEYIDARLFEHITQLVMPGQFVVYSGKRYKVHAVSPLVGCILHRAADTYDNRYYYRQLRHYYFDQGVEQISTRKVMDIGITFERRNFHVETRGYLQLEDNNNLTTAKHIDLSDDVCIDNYNRYYKNKSVIKISLPDTTSEVRFTITFLLNEMFRTVFPDSWQYLAVLSSHPENFDGMMDNLNYHFHGDIDENMIYIIEDSDMDLGLLEAIDNNLMRLFEIMSDYLTWHFEKMAEKPAKDPVIITEEQEEKEEEQEKLKKQGFFSKLFSKLFGKKKKNKDEPQEELPEGLETKEDEPNESEAIEAPDELQPLDDIPETETQVEPIEVEKTAYQAECFLNLGSDEIDSRLALEEVSAYLENHHWNNSNLTKSRKGTTFQNTRLDLNAENQCDFCGAPLSGVSFDRLADGRVRCSDCSITAINDVPEFKKLFTRTEIMMENIYNINFAVNVGVITTDAKTIARQRGRVFVPSREFAARVLGYAQRKGNTYNLVIENGSPRLASVDTITHEMTHIWQYLNWDDNQILKIYAQSTKQKTLLARDILYEGMAMWSAIQLLYTLGETSYAQEQEMLAMSRTDVYGIGFILYREQYPLNRNGENPAFTPFMNFPPLSPEDVRSVLTD